MAITASKIAAVRVMDEDGQYVSYEWTSATWYTIRDDRPYLDILVVGKDALSKDKRVHLEKLTDPAPEGACWQRWNFEQELAKDRRFGEISLPLKVPEDAELRCYIIPTALLSYGDVLAMIEDIEVELGVDATWDAASLRSDRSWSRPSGVSGRMAVQQIISDIEEELPFAHSIRRNPFSELGPRSSRRLPLPENATVSHWAMKRYILLEQSTDQIANELHFLKKLLDRHNPVGRLPDIRDSIGKLNLLNERSSKLKNILSHFCKDDELHTSISPGPLLQRDHRLRYLLRAFAPRSSEVISTSESTRSHYPPIFLNTLWELWGAVWLVKVFRRWGFTGSCFVNPVDNLHSCSWRLERGNITIELDFEAHPTFIDYAQIPPVHERNMPVLEWAAINQPFDEKRPFFGSEEKSSPDYLVRVTSPSAQFLMVGDACLASPQHHAIKKPQDSKTNTVDKYRQTIGWVSDADVVRCHPLGGFVLFPPPAESWIYIQKLPSARDCTLLSPSSRDDDAAVDRLTNLMTAICPELAAGPG